MISDATGEKFTQRKIENMASSHYSSFFIEIAAESDVKLFFAYRMFASNQIYEMYE